VGHQFAAATAVTRADGGPRGGVTYAAEVHDGWDIGGVANGGYLLAIAGRAVADFTGRAPMTVTAHYLSPGLPGPAEVVVEPVKAGKRLATVTASLRRGETELIRVLATCGEVADDGVRLVGGGPPELPPYEDCVDDSTSDPDAPPALGLAMPTPGLMERLGLRLRPGDDAFRFGRTTGRAEIAGWFAFRDGEPIDAVALLLVADAFAPPIFNAGIGPSWVPTVELTVHVRATPVPGPLRCRFASRFVAGGLLSEDGEIWDSADTLVAESRQLALTPRT
jgi:hypothetical protein